ncbi:hypothetical protein Acsp04_26260 [Actinomadura sp. NBRC 104425]|uniref:hypothetical protein n=1 Tax=Actinomadura sp. NBRC 104425 TaxID=3032204 RepID=UPI0024A5FF0E|nr:hypothetical protein [Actinomadura sp. NBRC 104425]GLZ12391.1 hypothetical protein Acsp04_26260 [Actinomadura sp. NBRC 104425]
MPLRDDIETVLRAWNALEVNRGASPIIDFDCHPGGPEPEPAPDRLTVYRRLADLHQHATGLLAARLDADLAYLGALLGERPPLNDYVRATQGCDAAGWPDDYIAERFEQARTALADLGIAWGPDTNRELRQAEGPLDVSDAPDAIRSAANDLEPAIRQATGSNAPYTLTIETAEVDAYWAYWLDGAGHNVRLRLNLPNVEFTQAGARQFALHEVLGHGLQSASYTARAAAEDVPWVRLLSIHAPHQVLLEGLAQAWPLFVLPDDKVLIARVRLAHYTQLVLGQVHRAINAGTPAAECADHLRACVPWWSDKTIAGYLTDRGTDPTHRTYMWAYPAGFDWFAALADADAKVSREVLHAAYRDPLTPTDLARLWPDGPPIGGPGGPVRLRKPPVP